MTDEYTPETEDVAATFAYIQGDLDIDDGYPPFRQVHEAEFYRWLNNVRAEAWDECVDAYEEVAWIDFATADRPHNPYRKDKSDD